jgi:hypothetical protein
MNIESYLEGNTKTILIIIGILVLLIIMVFTGMSVLGGLNLGGVVGG